MSIGSDLEEADYVGLDGGPPGHDGGPAPDAAGRDGATPTDAGPAAEGVLRCPWGMPLPADPPDASSRRYRRDCTTASDCTKVTHLADCCGTEIKLGANAAESARFSVIGGVCGSFAVCDCLGGRPRADDGETSTLDDGSDIALTCNAGRCETAVTKFACGDKTCDVKTEFCEERPPGIGFPDGGAPPTQYKCAPVPAACAGAPTCGCVKPPTPSAACREVNGRVTVMYLVP